MGLNGTIRVGEKSPLWSAQSNSGDVNLADYLGKSAVLLFFYPADWSDVCSDELPLLEELVTLAGKVQLKTFGISSDSVSSHNAFARDIGLRLITLISDPLQKISEAYGLAEAEIHSCKRASVLIDSEGMVRWVRVEPHLEDHRPIPEIEKALEMVREWNGLSGSIEQWREERQQAVQLPRFQPLSAPETLTVRFWGTRGSIPVSGLNYSRYGGNTSCVSLTSDSGHLFILDCGSGARELGNFLLDNPQAFKSHCRNAEGQAEAGISGYMLLSHTHWDHIQGFPFFGPVFQPNSRFNIIGWSNCSQTIGSIMAGQMEYVYFPVGMEDLPSNLSFFSIRHGSIELDGAKIQGRLLKHPTPSTCYRLELGGKVLVYATDHEPLTVPDNLPDTLMDETIIEKSILEMARNADILIHDAQYSIKELQQKVGWGHCSVEVAVDTAIRAGVRRLVLFHHDPAHDDATVDGLLSAALARAACFKNHNLEITVAYDGLALDL